MMKILIGDDGSEGATNPQIRIKTICPCSKVKRSSHLKRVRVKTPKQIGEDTVFIEPCIL
jgi:hypothetical protein